jgi:hypothetical protein
MNPNESTSSKEEPIKKSLARMSDLSIENDKLRQSIAEIIEIIDIDDLSEDATFIKYFPNLLKKLKSAIERAKLLQQ